MDSKRLLILTALILTSLVNSTVAQDKVVRLARVQIDAAHLDTYKAALTDEIETSLRIEPGVLALYAVSEKKDPGRITILEIYANADAYRAHLETPHFKKYKADTLKMVKSLELVDVDPILLGGKAK